MAETLIKLHVEALPEGGYVATSDDIPGLVAQGRTIAETMEIAQDVAKELIESYMEHGDPLPERLKHIDISYLDAQNLREQFAQL